MPRTSSGLQHADGVSFSVLKLDVGIANKTLVCGPVKYKAALYILVSKLVIISLHPILCHSVLHSFPSSILMAIYLGCIKWNVV